MRSSVLRWPFFVACIYFDSFWGCVRPWEKTVLVLELIKQMVGGGDLWGEKKKNNKPTQVGLHYFSVLRGQRNLPRGPKSSGPREDVNVIFPVSAD